ncbi:MAG: hypothetical protein ACHQM6_08140, partial [Candidatus Kapaibacterium sp.]
MKTNTILRLLGASILLSCITGCSKHDEAAPVYSSHELLMDGSCFVPDIGVPQQIRVLTIGDTTSTANFLQPII